MLYIAYGSNMDPVGMARRCPAAQRVGRGKLPGWRLVFRGVADIEPRRGEETPIAVWRITEKCLRALDAYEGYPSLYERGTVPLRLRDGTVEDGIVYFMADPSGERPPSAGYLATIERGYDFWGIHRGPLYEAEDAAYAYCDERGAVAYVPDGRKRLRPVYASEAFDELLADGEAAA